MEFPLIFLRVAEMGRKPNQIGRFFGPQGTARREESENGHESFWNPTFRTEVVFWTLGFQKNKLQPTDLADFWSQMMVFYADYEYGNEGQGDHRFFKYL